MKRWLFTLLLVVSLCDGQGQSTIAYFNGPAFQIPALYNSAAIDFYRDGTPDVGFWGDGSICTTDIPVSLCTRPFYVGASSTNSILRQAGQIAVVPAGTAIGSMSLSNAVWGDPGQGGLLTANNWSERNGTSGWVGPLSTVGDGFLGVRLQKADGLHYGWMHARMPSQQPGTNNFPLEFAPVVLDWACETRPNVAIAAGAKPVVVLQALPEIARPGFLRLRWQTEIGKAYQIQSKENLSALAWTNLDFVIVATATNAVADIPITGATRFYRVVEAD